MEMFYRRDTRKSYLIMQGNPACVCFEDEMLKNNDISCILPFKTAVTNDITQVWYDITGRRSLLDRIEESGHVTAEILYDLFGGLEKAFRELGRYLIGSSRIYLSAETIYCDRNKVLSELQLCYLPLEKEEDGEGLLLNVMEYLITAADHREEDITRLCYDLYEQVQTGETDAGKLKRQVAAFMEKRKTAEFQEPLRESMQKTMQDSMQESMQETMQRSMQETMQKSVQDSMQEFIPDWEPLPRQSKGEKTGREYRENEELYARVEPFENAGVPAISEYPPAVLSGTIIIDPPTESSGEGLFPQVTKAVGRLMERIRFKSTKQTVHWGKKKDNALQEPRLLFDEFETEENEDEDATCMLAHPIEMKAKEKEPPKGLLIYKGDKQQDSFSVETEVFTIGSGKGNDGVIESGHVSRRHGKITHNIATGEYWVEDLNSLNGTVVNGTYLPPHKKYQVYAGDEISFAGVEFTIR